MMTQYRVRNVVKSDKKSWFEGRVELRRNGECDHGYTYTHQTENSETGEVSNDKDTSAAEAGK